MFAYVWVAEPKYKITFDKEFFARPDTIRMFVESIGDEEGPMEEMNVNIIDGRGIAILQDTLGNTFGTDIIERRYSRITKELRLVISPSAPPPLATKIAGNGTVWSEAEPEPERIIVQVFNRWSHVKSGRAEVKKSQMVAADILLGETKYYYAAADPTDQTKLKIEESSDPVTTSPAIQAQFTVEPVSTTPSFSIQLASSQRSLVAEPTQVTEKLGVYWEKKYPVWSGNTFVGMAELPAGVMRLVGRYWEEGKTYKVKLTASYPGKTGSIEIEVKNPARLGNSYAKSRDVFDNEIDIDDLCVKYGGEFGIPPQLIKGQMEKEAPTKNFGPYVGFAPAYRYEPFTTELLFQSKADKWKTNPFWVTTTSMGTGDQIPMHQHTQFISYPTTPQALWDMVARYSHLVSAPSPGAVVLYGLRNSDGTMDFARYGYTTMQKFYDILLADVKRNTSLTGIQAADSARLSMIAFLRDSYADGFANIVAQTRFASSYGLLQMLYGTALERQYPLTKTDIPENLNVNGIFFPFAGKHQQRLLERILSADFRKDGDWSKGFDKVMKEMLEKWNTIENYADIVMRFSRRYLPVR